MLKATDKWGRVVIRCMVFNKAATTCLPECSTVRSTFASNIRFHEWPANILYLDTHVTPLLPGIHCGSNIVIEYHAFGIFKLLIYNCLLLFIDDKLTLLRALLCG